MEDSRTETSWVLETGGQSQSSFTTELARSSRNSSTIVKTLLPSPSATVVNSSLNYEISSLERRTGPSSSKTCLVDSKDEFLKLKSSTHLLLNLQSSFARWSVLLFPSPSPTEKVAQHSSLLHLPKRPLLRSEFVTSTRLDNLPKDTLTTRTAHQEDWQESKLSEDVFSLSCLTPNDQYSCPQTRGTRRKIRRTGRDEDPGQLCSNQLGNGSLRFELINVGKLREKTGFCATLLFCMHFYRYISLFCLSICLSICLNGRRSTTERIDVVGAQMRNGRVTNAARRKLEN